MKAYFKFLKKSRWTALVERSYNLCQLKKFKIMISKNFWVTKKHHIGIALTALTVLYHQVANAEWEKWSESPEGDISFVDFNDIKIENHTRLFTERKKYQKKGKSGEKSSEYIYAIDCKQKTFEVKQISFFEDDDWKVFGHSINPEGMSGIIRPDTRTELLANLVCDRGSAE